MKEYDDDDTTISGRVLINQSVRACDLGKLLLLGVSGTISGIIGSIPCGCIECITASVPPAVIVQFNPIWCGVGLNEPYLSRICVYACVCIYTRQFFLTISHFD